MSKIQLLLDIVEDLRSLAESVQAVANTMLQSEAEVETPAPAPAPKPEPRKVVTLEQVRAVLAEKSHDGFTADVRALLQKYGAEKLSAVDPEKYADLLADAEVLGNAP